MHCHSMVNARGCTLRPEWQCPLHCHSTSNVPKRCVQGRVAVPTTRGCTLRPEWQCRPHCHSMVNARAARPHTATRRRTYRNGALRAEWQCGFGWLHAQGRVAVPLTLPLDVERTGCTPSHCHSTSSVPKRCVQGRMAGPPRRPSGATAGQGVCRPPGCRERGESDEVREGPAPGKEPPRVRPGPARRPRRCERCAEIDEYVAQK